VKSKLPAAAVHNVDLQPTYLACLQCRGRCRPTFYAGTAAHACTRSYCMLRPAVTAKQLSPHLGITWQAAHEFNKSLDQCTPFLMLSITIQTL